MLFFHIQYKVFFFHTYVNIQAIAKDQRDLICGQLFIFVMGWWGEGEVYLCKYTFIWRTTVPETGIE